MAEGVRDAQVENGVNFWNNEKVASRPAVRDAT
jgi:hypothetical protein